MAELTGLGTALTQWQLTDTPVCVVRLADVHGFGAVAAGQLLLTDGQTTHGSLLGGAADAEASRLAGQVLNDGQDAVQTALRLPTDDAVGAGLACAGSATVFAHRLPPAQAELLAAGFCGGTPVALLSGPGGVLVTVGQDAEQVAGELEGVTDQALQQIRQALRRGRSVTTGLNLGGQRADLDLWVPTAQLLLVGAGVLGEALAAQAELLGWSVRTCTGVAETEQAVSGLTAADALVLLDHDPAFDGALLRCVRGPAFPGALGSRQTQADRRDRLQAAGASDAELAAIHGPVGLDLGARTPAETAVSVVAEIIGWRAGREPAALTESAGRIGA